jgi:hypothetical protein
MEKSAIANLSAYNRVCTKFIEACEVEKMDPSECLQAIARFLGVAIATSFSSSSPVSTSSLSQPGKTTQIKLSPEQAETVKREARAAKAKILGLRPNEVNLTPKEAKDAKAAARAKLEKGETIVPTKKKENSPSISNQASAKALSDEKKSEPRVVEVKENTPSPRLQRDPNEKDLPKSGQRATALTKVKAMRKHCLQTVPTAILDPRVLHLVAYSNHLNALARQWNEFKECFEHSKLKNPLGGLPDPWKLNECKAILNRVKSQLEEQSSSPGTFTLQNDGKSFWDRDKPSEACPADLRESLPKSVLDEFDLYGQSKN